MKPTTLYFDLDNTLYSPYCGLWDAISQRISEYMTIYMHIPIKEVISFRQYCRENYGSTYQGLKSKYELDEVDYLNYIHNVDVNLYLHPDLELRSMLDSFPQRKIVFTNSILIHARKVLTAMGIIQCFDQIIDFFQIIPFSKLQKDAFLIALNTTYEPFPKNCVMIDNSIHVLEVAHQMNFFCINPWNGNAEITNNEIITLPDILSLPKAIELISKN